MGEKNKKTNIKNKFQILSKKIKLKILKENFVSLNNKKKKSYPIKIKKKPKNTKEFSKKQIANCQIQIENAIFIVLKIYIIYFRLRFYILNIFIFLSTKFYVYNLIL